MEIKVSHFVLVLATWAFVGAVCGAVWMYNLHQDDYQDGFVSGVIQCSTSPSCALPLKRAPLAKERSI